MSDIHNDDIATDDAADNAKPNDFDGSLRDSKINRINVEMINDIIAHTRLTFDNINIHVNEDGDIDSVLFNDIDELESTVIIPAIMRPYTERIDQLGTWSAGNIISIDKDGNACSVDSPSGDTDDEDDEFDKVADSLADTISEQVDRLSTDMRAAIRAVSIAVSEDRIPRATLMDVLDEHEPTTATLFLVLSRLGVADTIHRAMYQMEIEDFLMQRFEPRLENDSEMLARTVYKKLADCLGIDLDEDDDEPPSADNAPEMHFDENPEHSDESPMALESALELINRGMDAYDDVPLISEQTKVPERVVKIMIDQAHKRAKGNKRDSH